MWSRDPPSRRTILPIQLSVSIDKFPPHILKELTDGGFVEVQLARSRAFTDRVIACDGVYDFAARVRTLHRLHLLAADQPSEFAKYVDHAFFGDPAHGGPRRHAPQRRDPRRLST